MRIAVQDPYFILQNQERNFNGYNFVFLRDYADVIYVSNKRLFVKFLLALHRYGIKKKICLTVKSLNKYADVVISFNGRPDKKHNCPPLGFKGLKFCHLMDFVFYPSLANAALETAGVDYVFTYSNHGQQSDFFRAYYPKYSDKTISIPFGYGKRFINKIPYKVRINKCVALGSINPVNDHLCPPGMLNEYTDFYKDIFFTHYLRRAIVEHRNEWRDVFVADALPVYPETKNPSYDAVSELNKYTMFVNDAGIMQFPPARTYEGIACGAVMVAEDLPCFREMGFVSGKNCIMFKPGHFDEMVEKVRYYQVNFDDLAKIQAESLKLAAQYSHEQVAKRLYERLLMLPQKERKS